MAINLTAEVKVTNSKQSSVDSETNLSDEDKFEYTNTPTRYNVPSVASISCRICLTDAAQERLIQPCYCKGTIAFVHRTCLENWLNQIGSTFCELCRFNYDVELTHRYSICKSLHIWLKHPRIMTMMRGDLIIGGLVTLVMVTLVTLCFLGSELLFTETMEMGATSAWSTSSINLCLAIFFIGYLFVIYLLFKSHVYLWFSWYQRCVNVRLKNIQEPPPQRVVVQVQSPTGQENEVNPSTSQQVECTTLYERESARAMTSNPVGA